MDGVLVSGCRGGELAVLFTAAVCPFVVLLLLVVVGADIDVFRVPFICGASVPTACCEWVETKGKMRKGSCSVSLVVVVAEGKATKREVHKTQIHTQTQRSTYRD